MDDLNKQLGNEIDRQLRARGKTAYWLAEVVGVRPSALYKIARGGVWPRPETLSAIAAALETAPAALLGGGPGLSALHAVLDEQRLQIERLEAEKAALVAEHEARLRAQGDELRRAVRREGETQAGFSCAVAFIDAALAKAPSLKAALDTAFAGYVDELLRLRACEDAEASALARAGAEAQEEGDEDA